MKKNNTPTPPSKEPIMESRKVKVWVSVSRDVMYKKQPFAWLHFGRKKPETDKNYKTTRVEIRIPK